MGTGSKTKQHIPRKLLHFVMKHEAPGVRRKGGAQIRDFDAAELLETRQRRFPLCQDCLCERPRTETPQRFAMDNFNGSFRLASP
ncbi:hypothetical protein Q5P01_004160 [Channa striata]|uniref:Uncharacterized protein n=1 Tax=Channa striata TaxID=64152 RepID=A0AA88NN51_CHASR|nr:hypothetical protein Q5P01_004160 [Channa striata]